MKTIILLTLLVFAAGGFLKKAASTVQDPVSEWRGKVFYTPVKSIQESYSLTDITLLQNMLKLQYSETKYETIRINCLDQKKLPCNIEQYAKKLTNDQAAIFLQNAKLFLKKTDGQIEEPEKSCIIIQISSAKDKPAENYLICAKDAKLASEMKAAVIISIERNI